MKQRIKEYALGLGLDDVGFASVAGYHSPQGPEIETLFPGARSIVVGCVREMSHVESPNPQLAMNGRLDVQEFARGTNYKLSRFIENECGGRAMSVPLSYPLNLDPAQIRTVADVSLRHAAVAAGLGAFGRNNLVLHPRLGARVLFLAVLTDLAIEPDEPVKENPCTGCNICVETCPSRALDVEGQTDFMKCIMVSQPYGLPKNVMYWLQWAGRTPDEQKKMVLSKDFFMMYQAGFIGFQYFCYKCYAGCPVGKE